MPACWPTFVMTSAPDGAQPEGAAALDRARAWLTQRQGDFVQWRHALHAQPELAFQEHATSAFVAGKLSSWGLQVERGIGGTGVIATLPTTSTNHMPTAGRAGATIGLRADMDALPVHECPGRAHGSAVPGQMHACGHDGHTTMLLAAAHYLAQASAAGLRLPQGVCFIFQPAEENAGGARVLLEQGLFERHPVERIFGLHNLPGCPTGQFLTRSGPVAAGFDTFDLKLVAQGGHAAFPAAGGDAIAAASSLIAQLHTIVSRDLSATDSAVVAVTQVHGGSAYNILPDQVHVAGSVRWFAPHVRNQVRRRIEQLAQGVATAWNVKVEVTYEERYPAVINEASAARQAIVAAQSVRPLNGVVTDFAPLMGSDDFAFLAQKRPGAYVGIGNGAGSDPGAHALHSPEYDFNDDLIVSGALYWIALCLTPLEAS